MRNLVKVLVSFMTDKTEGTDTHHATPLSGVLKEFHGFVVHSNVVDVAIGVSIGAAFTAIVDGLIQGVLNPLISLLVGGHDVSNLFVTVEGKHAKTLTEAHNAGAVVLNGTIILNAVMHLVIVLAVILWIVKTVMGMRRRYTGVPPPPKPAQAVSTYANASSANSQRTEILLEKILSELAASNAARNIDPLENSLDSSFESTLENSFEKIKKEAMKVEEMHKPNKELYG